MLLVPTWMRILKYRTELGLIFFILQYLLYPSLSLSSAAWLLPTAYRDKPIEGVKGKLRFWEDNNLEIT